jgi:hypothetical protein
VINWACSTYGRYKYMQYLFGKLKEEHHFGDLVVNEMTVLE